MSRIYLVPYTGTLTNAGGDTDLLSVQPADDKPCELVGIETGQTSELGDSAEEYLRLTVRHMTATFTVGSGGSAVTPVPSGRPGTDLAAGFTARCNDTTVATTSGTSTIVRETSWNERASPYERWLLEEVRTAAVQTEAILVRNETTAADDLTICLTFIVREHP